MPTVSSTPYTVQWGCSIKTTLHVFTLLKGLLKMSVTIYTQSQCPACVKLKAEYKRDGVLFTEIEIGVDISVSEFKETFPKVRSVPFVVNE
jgi:glutaredoxin